MGQSDPDRDNITNGAVAAKLPFMTGPRQRLELAGNGHSPLIRVTKLPHCH
jgi:hypothetical protein